MNKTHNGPMVPAGMSVLVVVGGLLLFFFSNFTTAKTSLAGNIQGFTSTRTDQNSVIYPNVKGIELEYAADYANDKILMGASHDVFVGRVMGQIGSAERGIGPETQFAVQVITNIKGNLQGTVTVDQEGGYKNGALYVVEDSRTGSNEGNSSSYLLQPGTTYLLATRYSSQHNWYTLNPFPTASKLISNNNAASVTDLKTLANSDARVQQLQAMYPSEVLFKADIAHNNTLNSYASLTEMQKAALPYSKPSFVQTSFASTTSSTFSSSTIFLPTSTSTTLPQ